LVPQAIIRPQRIHGPHGGFPIGWACALELPEYLARQIEQQPDVLGVIELVKAIAVLPSHPTSLGGDVPGEASDLADRFCRCPNPVLCDGLEQLRHTMELDRVLARPLVKLLKDCAGMSDLDQNRQATDLFDRCAASHQEAGHLADLPAAQVDGSSPQRSDVVIGERVGATRSGKKGRHIRL
jgi:hypothetical protein